MDLEASRNLTSEQKISVFSSLTFLSCFVRKGWDDFCGFYNSKEMLLPSLILCAVVKYHLFPLFARVKNSFSQVNSAGLLVPLV